MRFQTPLFVVASLLSAASAWPAPDPGSRAREIGVSPGADFDYGQNKRDNNPVARAGGFVPGFEPVGKGGEPIIPAAMPPPQGHTGPGAGKNTEDDEPPHGDGGKPPETQTAAGPPHPAPTLEGTNF